ncbi:glycoside hydrolase family 2 protein [Cyclobacterium marinum]|uniref:Glycoside hydrolase family 2 sugar binding protein n=1 Tax=Cyclobacterium marinum (strain ATCC 25205 / DSM 745 / LMG 13164 / NCIMB 1802) TaxID=880070 RepID=G0J7B1_CYCMS|nr:sugar-binding domain-containing protein [Cyclobacterium marinum]AEL27744.1 glycoside hydrolase family 2 sugar binding protein [Cyclobacterium marinum DSM 745]MBR9777831.1 beta-galactosidase [Cytophagales bacterium]|tara:strand:- start:50768 stop:52612 length:1845 start_codon:yes stop_codon:yes gene_type:complete
MIKKITCWIALVFLVFPTFSQQHNWQPKKDKILSEWAINIDPNAPLPEYPRPQMSRENWTNLNGIWKYTIIEKGSTEPENFQGDILVPYAIESALSGVGQTVSKDQELWYHRSFEVDRGMRKGNLLLHFGAVDWEAEVFINGKSVGMHQGGYDPFSFEISEALVSGRKQQLSIRVWDPTDEGPQPRGKQINKPHGIWYTPVTGIWQTVWLEAVPDQYISHIKNTADLDNKQISVETQVNDPQPGQMITVRLFTNGELLDEKEVPAGESTIFSIDNPNIWGPDNPFLYDIEARLMDGRKQLDAVKSYTAMRKISMKPDAYGNQRLLLNDKFLFQYGPLDQGWWPDGLYTAPTEEALVYDIDKTKEMGFNMIRKHVKVEPARWYYHCDKIGMLVWQDMPSGDMGNRWEARPGVVGKGTERKRSPESMAIFKKEWKAIMDANYNFPSIIVWVPFNEAWGQFNTEEIVKWTVEYDPSRLVNGASGGNYTLEGQIMDMHNYPDPVMPDPKIWGHHQIIVLGEYGGLGLPIEGHTWQNKDNWGYQSFKDKDALRERYSKLIQDLKPLIPMGLSAAIYTQTTDVEVETNGLMTYDRKVSKLEPQFLKQLHKELYTIKIPMK